MIQLNTLIPIEFAGQRLDAVLAQLFPQYSRARLQQWIKNNFILIDGVKRENKYRVLGGENIIINAPPEKETQWQAQAIPLNIIYEDKDLIIINKPVGMVVHPAAGHFDDTLVNALLHYVPELEALPRAGIVHRLDKETSGLLVVARTLKAHTALIRQLQKRTMHREYIAIVQGVLTAGGIIDLAIGRHPHHRTQQAVREDGKSAITHYRVLERFRAHTLVQANLETGRTHQIRVHFAAIYHPLVGDPVYGGRLKLPREATEELKNVLQQFKHQALHAKALSLIHPDTEELLHFEAPLPDDIENLIQQLRDDIKK